jgi:2-oxoglutarate ferredoxin oxidoreductase subunit alpha
VKTFQAEDEIAAVCAAIGASYGGGLGVTASSGPGLSLKTEALGLAITAELPLLVIDVQRAGPSTGMPTKPEQSDLEMAIFGRHGEAPLPVFAPATPADCFDIVVEAARTAVEAMTPVIVLSDAYLANAMSEWVAPDPKTLMPFQTASRAAAGEGAYDRDPETLARHWMVPGTAGGMYRVGGIEKDAKSGHISYDPANHAAMVGLRAEKVARVAARAGGTDMLQEGDDSGDIAVVGWGSTFGPVREAARRMRAEGMSVTHFHIRRLWPLPLALEAALRRFKHVACVEMNTGHLTRILRSTYLLPVQPITQINGRPFRVADVKDRLAGLVPGEIAA